MLGGLARAVSVGAAWLDRTGFAQYVRVDLRTSTSPSIMHTARVWRRGDAERAIGGGTHRS
jgi:hypothetical protein